MKDLIEALQIFAKYIPDEEYPTGCEHDMLRVYVDHESVLPLDIERLEELGFVVDDDIGCFRSYRYGSA